MWAENYSWVNRQRGRRISLFNSWIFASAEAVVMGESWGKASYALCWGVIKERWKTICFSRSSSCECSVMKTGWWLWQGLWGRELWVILIWINTRGGGLVDRPCEVVMPWLPLALGCILQLDVLTLNSCWSGQWINTRGGGLVDRQFVVVMPWSFLGQGCLLQLDVFDFELLLVYLGLGRRRRVALDWSWS